MTPGRPRFRPESHTPTTVASTRIVAPTLLRARWVIARRSVVLVAVPLGTGHGPGHEADGARGMRSNSSLLPILRQAFWTTSSTLDGFPMRSRCLTAVEATTPDRSRPLIVRASSGSSRDAAGGPEALKSKRPASVRLTWLSFAPCGPLVRGRRGAATGYSSDGRDVRLDRAHGCSCCPGPYRHGRHLAGARLVNMGRPRRADRGPADNPVSHPHHLLPDPPGAPRRRQTRFSQTRQQTPPAQDPSWIPVLELISRLLTRSPPVLSTLRATGRTSLATSSRSGRQTRSAPPPVVAYKVPLNRFPARPDPPRGGTNPTRGECSSR